MSLGAKTKFESARQASDALVRQWDYDEWGDTTEASLALEEVLRQWLEIEIVPGAEEQIRHASLGGTRGTEEVGEESDDSEGSDDEKGNDMCMQASWPAASGANAGGTTASGASAGGTTASGASADCADSGTDWVFTKTKRPVADITLESMAGLL